MPRQPTPTKKPRSPLAHPEEGDLAREETFEWLCYNLEPITSSLFDMPQEEIDVEVSEALKRWQIEAERVAEDLKGLPEYCGLSKTLTAALNKRVAHIERLVRLAKVPEVVAAWGAASLLDWNPAAAITALRDRRGPGVKRHSEAKIAAYVDVAATVRVVKRFTFLPVPKTIDRDDYSRSSKDKVAELLEAEVELPQLGAVPIDVDVWFDVRVREFRVADLLRELRDLEGLDPRAYIAVVTGGEIAAAPQRLLEQAGFGIVSQRVDGDPLTSTFRGWLPD